MTEKRPYRTWRTGIETFTIMEAHPYHKADIWWTIRVQENTRLRTIYSGPYAEKSMPMTKDELHEQLISEGAFPDTPKSGVSAMGWCLTRRCASRLPATCKSYGHKGLELVTIWTTMRIDRTAVAVRAHSVMRPLSVRGKDASHAKTTEDESTRRGACEIAARPGRLCSGV